jgi:Mrp family chromosome partitioning ATPase
MSRLHDALRKAALETDQQSSGSLALNGELLDQAEGLRCEETCADPQARESEQRPLDLSQEAQEHVVKFVQRVFVFPNSSAPRLVVFSSVDEGNGSSQICFRSVAALSTQVPGSVCLVDANLDAPSLHQFAGVEKSPGFAEAISDTKSIRNFAVRIAGGGNLWLVPSGSRGVEGSSLFTSNRLRYRMQELKEEFDYVLVDAPPVGSCGDAVLLGQVSDGIVLVVEANSTRRETARKAKESFESANVKLLGAILNNSTLPKALC